MEDPDAEKIGGTGAAADGSGVGGDPYEVVAGQHRGALAGIWGEERDRLGLDDMKVRMGEIVSVPAVVRNHYSSKCMAGTPISSLADVLMTRTRDEIVRWAKWLRLVSYSSLRKAELARWVAHFFVEDPKDVLDLLQEGGKLCVEGARADVIDRAAHYLEALVSYRGMVEVDEAFSILMSHPDYEDLRPCDLETLNTVVMGSELISCTFVKFNGDVTGRYVVDPLLIREVGLDSKGASSNGRNDEYMLVEIIEANRGIEPRPLSGLKPGDDAMGFFLSPDTNPVAKEIIAYLDEHVPDGGDDYNFAERVLEDTILMDWQHDFRPEQLHLALRL